MYYITYTNVEKYVVKFSNRKHIFYISPYTYIRFSFILVFNKWFISVSCISKNFSLLVKCRRFGKKTVDMTNFIEEGDVVMGSMYHRWDHLPRWSWIPRVVITMEIRP